MSLLWKSIWIIVKCNFYKQQWIKLSHASRESEDIGAGTIYERKVLAPFTKPLSPAWLRIKNRNTGGAGYSKIFPVSPLFSYNSDATNERITSTKSPRV